MFMYIKDCHAATPFLLHTPMDEFLFVLTLKQVQMAIPNLITELEPTLLTETEMLYARSLARHKRRVWSTQFFRKPDLD
jgi:hypothetical protein